MDSDVGPQMKQAGLSGLFSTFQEVQRNHTFAHGKGGKDSGADANSVWSHQVTRADQESD